MRRLALYSDSSDFKKDLPWAKIPVTLQDLELDYSDAFVDFVLDFSACDAFSGLTRLAIIDYRSQFTVPATGEPWPRTLRYLCVLGSRFVFSISSLPPQLESLVVGCSRILDSPKWSDMVQPDLRAVMTNPPHFPDTLRDLHLKIGDRNACILYSISSLLDSCVIHQTPSPDIRCHEITTWRISRSYQEP